MALMDHRRTEPNSVVGVPRTLRIGTESWDLKRETGTGAEAEEVLRNPRTEATTSYCRATHQLPTDPERWRGN